MNMILVMVLCLIGSPDRYETIRAPEWPAHMSLLDCAMFGQHFASDWLRLHPNYDAHSRLRSWRCEAGERPERGERAVLAAPPHCRVARRTPIRPGCARTRSGTISF